MTGFSKGKISTFNLKNNKKLLFIITMLTINVILFMIPKNYRVSKAMVLVDEKYGRLRKKMLNSSKVTVSTDTTTEVINNNNNNLRYILQWFPNAFVNREGQTLFIENNCKHKNCYISNRKDLLGDYTNFNAVIFHGPTVVRTGNRDLPQIRVPYQKYVFVSTDSSDEFPVCSVRFDGYFNWTWTFRLDSDISLAFIVIRDINGTIIGPKPEMHWMKIEDMNPLTQNMQDILNNKYKFAAWLVSNCNSRYAREHVVEDLNKELQAYGLKYKVDIFGLCGDKKCPPDTFCEEIIRQDYLFSLAFENSCNQDFVSEALLVAVQMNTIPVVFGSANYTRFLPEGSYLSINELGMEKLAAQMVDIANDFEQLSDFFKWTSHYTLGNSNEEPDSNNYCKFCEFLNNEKETQKITVKKNFQEWWDPPNTNC